MSIHSKSKTPPSGGSPHPLPTRPAAPRPSGRAGMPGCPLRPAAHRPAAEPPLTWEELLGRR
ncbi:hypothetical protein [Cyanobium sp. CH-040]|uniref:hypothetical protein n=1 Tax=Cyanobium sp. CH-040 TaxID=2823708 RepID=UPI0020CCFE4D|nr:hypothetical protein [Cyanobium sp. CH-040]